MNSEILNKVDEIIRLIEESSEYQKYLLLKKEISDNNVITALINEVKVLQKDVVHHLNKKEELDKKMYELNNYPLYREYNNTVIDINNMYAIIENALNKYFTAKLN